MLDFIDNTKKLPKGPIQWSQKDHRRARFLREVEGYSYPEIIEEMGIPERTIKSWAEKEVWKKKGADAQKVEDFTRQRFLELAAANNMPKQRAVALLVKGMTEPEIETTKEKVTEEGEVIAEPKTLPDYGTRHKYQKDYWTLVGLHGTNKQMEINNNANGTVNVQVIIPEKTT